ncbi:Two-component sensor [Lactobacillus psittaci DSM 15354]|uniref:Signal transduction histidine-protein kinase ArlS n=1 Tax=Lactobacillus psittaci DSM 15354 TaxID=1122152 RepID=A0A0R1S116_9LACO|nr:Two-component sensor [Lactobacillus psittaci DSM 15354]
MFSVIIYSLVSQQFFNQERQVTVNVIENFERRLTDINKELQISNVVPALSPNTRRILNGGPTISSDSESENLFDDDILQNLTNQDISVVVFNREGEAVFTNGRNLAPFISDVTHLEQKNNNEVGKQSLTLYKPIRSSVSHKITGYIAVTDDMSSANRMLNNLRAWMIGVSVIAICIFILISYFIIKGIVWPLNEMSKVAREIDKDPNSEVRIPDLQRRDELGELAKSFDQMLDRVQGYIQQQKQFVGDVSHELRTPVAVIEGHLSLLERWGKDDPQILEESIKASLQEADRMKHLIQEMLDLTRAEQIDIQYPNEVTNVSEVLTRVVSDLQLVHQDFTLQLNNDLSEDTMIQMYHSHFEQLLIILIDNAIKYSTDRKEVIVSSSVEDGEAVVSVQDFGEGISEGEKSKIFNRFYRVDKARTREKGGNGLGLSIAQKLTQSYHGKISVDSVLGSGSNFVLRFPVLTKKEVKQLNKKKEKAQRGK